MGGAKANEGRPTERGGEIESCTCFRTVCGADVRQGVQQSVHVIVGEVQPAALVGRSDDRFQSREELEAGRRDPAMDHAAVMLAALPTDKTLLLEPVQQPGDSRHLLDQPVADLQRRQWLRVRAAQDAQDVVLLRSHICGLEDGRDVPADDIGGQQDRDSCLLCPGPEGPGLLDLLGDGSRCIHGSNLGVDS